MKYVLSILLLYCTHTWSMEYSTYGEPNLFVLSDSYSSDETFEPSEDFFPSTQKTQFKEKKTYAIPFRKTKRTINTQKHKTTFLQRFIHMAASVMSCGKFIVTQEKTPYATLKKYHVDYAQDTIYFEHTH